MLIITVDHSFEFFFIYLKDIQIYQEIMISWIYLIFEKYFSLIQVWLHPRRPRDGRSGREKRRDESYQAQAEKPLGTDSHRTISKQSSECRLLIRHKKCSVLLCPFGEQHLLSSFREFVHDCYYGLSGSCTKECTQSGNFQFDINSPFQNTVYPKTKDAFPKIQP